MESRHTTPLGPNRPGNGPVKHHKRNGFYYEEGQIRFWLVGKATATILVEESELHQAVAECSGDFEITPELMKDKKEGEEVTEYRQSCVAIHEYPYRDEKKFWLWVANEINRCLDFDTDEQRMEFMKRQVERITLATKMNQRN